MPSGKTVKHVKQKIERDVKQPLNNSGPHRWTKGQSGNLNGRPKSEVCLTTAIKAQLCEIDPNDSQKRTKLEVLAERTIANAYADVNYLKQIWERIEGKIAQPIEGDINLNITGDMLAKAFREAQNEGEKSLKS